MTWLAENWGLVGWSIVIAMELFALVAGWETFSERAIKWYSGSGWDVRILMWGFVLWLPFHWFLPWGQEFHARMMASARGLLRR